MPRKKTTKKKGKKEGIVKKIEEKVEEAVEDLGEEIGKVTHYFDKLGVAVVELIKGVDKGQKVRVKGATTDFVQKIDSMQVEHEEIDKAKKGQAVGMKVKDRVRPHDKVYKEE